MFIQNLLNQIRDSSNDKAATGNTISDITDSLGKVSSAIPGGLAGGAAAGGLMALLMNNKSARKFAGKAATYGGAAVLGGLAYKAFQNWQQNDGQFDNAAPTVLHSGNEKSFIADARHPDFEMKLIEAMIAAAKADGHIDDNEQKHIFDTIDQLEMSTEMKGKIFDLMRQPISITDLVKGVNSIEQKSELYLASCLVMTPDNPAEIEHLDALGKALHLPEGLAEQLQSQARQVALEAAA